MRLAGIIKQYSKNATSQLMKMIATKPMRSKRDLNITWPYQANVINRFEQIKRPTADSPLTIIPFNLGAKV